MIIWPSLAYCWLIKWATVWLVYQKWTSLFQYSSQIVIVPPLPTPQKHPRKNIPSYTQIFLWAQHSPGNVPCSLQTSDCIVHCVSNIQMDCKFGTSLNYSRNISFYRQIFFHLFWQNNKVFWVQSCQTLGQHKMPYPGQYLQNVSVSCLLGSVLVSLFFRPVDCCYQYP